MPSLRALLLDLDGTLVDASDGIIDGVLALLLELGHEPPERTWLKGFIGQPPDAVWRALGIPDPAGMVERFAAHVMADLPARTHVLAGVEAALDELVADGYVLAVATTRRTDSARATLEAKGLARHMHAVVGRDRGNAPKPAPDILFAALSDLDCSPDEALMIGDTEFDALAARAAGVPCWGVLGGVGSEASLRAAGAEHILYDGLGGAPEALRARHGRRSTNTR